MPGHNQSIVGNMVAGDLNSREALWLWNRPVTNEELDIWHHINEYVLFTFIFNIILYSNLVSIFTYSFHTFLELLTCIRLLKKAGLRIEISLEMVLHPKYLMPPV